MFGTNYIVCEWNLLPSRDYLRSAPGHWFSLSSDSATASLFIPPLTHLPGPGEAVGLSHLLR